MKKKFYLASVVITLILASTATTADAKWYKFNKKPFQSKTAEDIQIDLLGNMLSGSSWRFDSLDEFNCFKVYTEKVKGSGAIVEYDIRTSLSGRSSAVLTDMSVTYKVVDKKLVYISNRLDSTNVWGPVDCDGRDI